MKVMRAVRVRKATQLHVRRPRISSTTMHVIGIAITAMLGHCPLWP